VALFTPPTTPYDRYKPVRCSQWYQTKNAAKVRPTYKVPHLAEITVGVIVAGVLLVDVRSVIGFSAFTVLLYCAITELHIILYASFADVRLTHTRRFSLNKPYTLG
jgi:hypothetical protein